VDGPTACKILSDFRVVDRDDCDWDQFMLGIEYVRVDPAHRGGGYSIALIETAVKAFTRRGWWVYADVFSQRIYANLRSVLGMPKVVVAANEEPIFAPSDDQVFAQLDSLPVEGQTPYRGYGYQLANKRHALVLWRV
jgi:GNAT superfamily N-acetyltransferase